MGETILKKLFPFFVLQIRHKFAERNHFARWCPAPIMWDFKYRKNEKDI